MNEFCYNIARTWINMGKRILFIDRDGVLVKEAPPSYQVDSWEKLEFYPEVFKWLGKIADEFDYVLIMVSNQDGLGTPWFPAENFWPIHQHIIKSFENEGVSFHATHIDTSFPEEHSPNRKPGIGMFTEYLNTPAYDIPNSFVIGDRITDVQLAKNLGCKAIWLNNHPGLGGKEVNDSLEELRKVVALETHHWKEIYNFLKLGLRKVVNDRNTNETKIHIEFGGRNWIVWNAEFTREKIGEMPTEMFFHFFKSFSDAAKCNLNIECHGENEHHKIEAIFKAFAKAIRMAVKRDPMSNYLPSTKGVL